MQSKHEHEHQINCSFCNKDRSEVFQIVEGPEFHGYKLYICNECIDISHDTINSDEDIELKGKKRKKKSLTPEQIKKHLDDYIVGQDYPKEQIAVAFYNHYKRINMKSKDVEIEKSNILMIGPSGSGKTLTVKTISKLLNLPYNIVDATTLTESGYVGDDVNVLIKGLISSAGNDIELAQTGVIFIDEIDKKGKKESTQSAGRDVSGEGVQQALLKMMEGTVITIETDDDTIEFDTKNVLFIFSGAFVGLAEIVKRNRSISTIGLGASLIKSDTNVKALTSINSEDLIKYGFIPEFIGRCPIHVVFDDVDVSMLVKILTEPKNSIVEQFKALFQFDGIELQFDDKYILSVANECIKEKIGARGLRSIIEKDLQSTQFILPSLAKKGVNKILIDENKKIKHFYKTTKRLKNEQNTG